MWLPQRTRRFPAVTDCSRCSRERAAGSCSSLRTGAVSGGSASLSEPSGAVVSFIENVRVAVDGIDGIRERSRASGAAVDAVWSAEGRLAVVRAGAVWAGLPGRLRKIGMATTRRPRSASRPTRSTCSVQAARPRAPARGRQRQWPRCQRLHHSQSPVRPQRSVSRPVRAGPTPRLIRPAARPRGGRSHHQEAASFSARSTSC